MHPGDTELSDTPETAYYRNKHDPGDEETRDPEAFRVLEPGGTLVLADSVQLADSPQFAAVMENFRRVFHEPFYRDYIGDDIDQRLSAAGFESIAAESHFMTRIWSARKPVP
jgi:hypothetical protein